MKKSLACLLALTLLLSGALAQEEAELSFASSLGAGSTSAVFLFDGQWFQGSAYEYRHELCKTSLAMALSAFRGSEEAPAKSAQSFFASLGFSPPVLHEFAQKGADTIGSAISHRIIGEGENAFPLVAIAVSGGNYELEWLSNFDTGIGQTHKGFLESAEKVVARAKEYVKENGLKNPRFWISGYSRAAAVANLTAVLLSKQDAAPDDRIFAYTFATPRTVIGEQAALYPNIFNIVNAADLVPHVPLEAWGYRWYGRTLYLPSALSQNADWAAQQNAFSAAYEAMTGTKPLPSPDASLIALMQEGIKAMSLTVPTLERYVQLYQPMINKLLLGEELIRMEEILMMTLVVNVANSALQGLEDAFAITDDPGRVFEALAPLAPALIQHMPEIYAAWLFAVEEDALLQNTLTLTAAPVL